MSTRRSLLATAASIGLAIVAADAATAQGMQGGMMQGGMEHRGMDHGAMPGGGASPGMDECMMRGGMRGMGAGMMGRGMMMGSGASQGGMMHGGMGSGMMGHHMGRGMGSGAGGDMMQGGPRSGMGALFGSHVRPVMNLSVEDVRGYLGMQLEGLNNKRLKLGELKAEDGTITADIVTVDNSLVQRLKVDRRSGAIEYVN